MADLRTGQDEPQGQRTALRRVLLSLRQPKVALATVFGVATGMPPVMVGVTLGLWLRQEGVALSAIGFMSWVGVFFATKFLWAPFVDRIRLPWLGRRLGHRRSWMLLGQAVVMIAILGMAVVGPGAGLQAFAALAMLTAFASATQDISVDAWRIESAANAEQDLVASAYTFGLRSGYFFGNAPILAGSALIGWSGAYALAALGGVLGLAAILLAREPQAARDFKPLQGPRATLAALWTPVRLFIHDHGRIAGIMLLLTALYFVPDGIIAPMVGPLYIDLGYQGAEIAAVRTVFGITAALLGVITAGVLGMRFGTLAVLGLGAALSAVSNLGFTALSLSGGSRAIWIIAVAIEGFSAGLAQTAMLAWAGRLTNVKATAAQFALLSSLMTLLPGFLGGFAGLAVETLQSSMADPLAGYATYFALTTCAGAGPLALILLLQRCIQARRNP